MKDVAIYGPINPTGAGGTSIIGTDKSNIIAAMNSIVTYSSNIKGMWFYDNKHTGDPTTIMDESGNSHRITLRNNSLVAINADTCNPGIIGSAPYLTFDATHVWDTPDHDDFSLTSGGGVDVAGTFVWAGVITDMTSSSIMCKYFSLTNNREYRFWITAADKLNFYLAHTDNGGILIGRLYNTALTAYEGQFVTIIVTNDGSKTEAGIKMYFLGSRVDDTTFSSGAYHSTTNSTALLASYQETTVIQPLKAKLSFQAFIKGEELAQTQVTAIDRLLRSWAGTTF